MPIVFYIPSYLRPFSGGNARIELAASAETVGDALDALWAKHPGIRDRIVTELGELRPHVNVFVGQESIRFSKGFATPLPSDCEIAILPAISGGS